MGVEFVIVVAVLRRFLGYSIHLSYNVVIILKHSKGLKWCTQNNVLISVKLTKLLKFKNYYTTTKESTLQFLFIYSIPVVEKICILEIHSQKFIITASNNKLV